MTPGTCIHFNGFGLSLDGRDNCCAAGANYEKEFGTEFGMFLRAPCIEYRVKRADGRGTHIPPGVKTIRVEIDRRGQTVIPCGRRIEPTDEQVVADQLETERAMSRILLGLKVASEWRVKPKPPRNRHEVVECPVCGGALHLSQSSYNGHVHAKCETPGCIAWME